MSNPSKHPKKAKAIPTHVSRRRRRDRTLVSITVLLIAAAWIIGYYTSGVDVAPQVAKLLPEADHIEKQADLFIGYNEDKTEILGYAATGEAPGYSGPIQVLVGIDPDGNVTGVKILKQSETPGFFRLVLNADMISQFVGRAFDAPFQLGDDIDAVSGATLSAEGVAAAARQAIQKIAQNGLEKPLPAKQRSIQFSGPEISLLALFAAGYVGHKMRAGAWKQRIRWGIMLAGILFVGFVYTVPLTITMIISLLSGYWPDWQANLYWYILIGGILFVTSVDGKNPYCGWFCPFGAVQETLATVTDAKPYRPKELRGFLTWLQRGLALLAILLGLALRRPGVAGYEPFAVFFDFQGMTVEWVFLAVILLGSLLVYRPFCTYLCPIDPTVALIAAMRRWARDVWRSWRRAR